MLRVAFLYAARHIIRSPFRSFLVVFTIAMIVSLYLLISSILTSFSDQYSALLDQGGSDIVIQEKFSASPISSSIPEKSITQICSDKKIRSCTKVTLGKGRIDGKHRVYVFGIDNFEKIAASMSIVVKKGHLKNTKEDDIVIGKGIAKKLNIKVGDTLRLFDGNIYTISAICESWISILNSSVVVDSSTAKRILNRPHRINMLFVELENKKDIDGMIEKIAENNKMLFASKSSTYAGSLDILRSMGYLSSIVSVITLVVCSAILMNIFLTTVRERSMEIGILNTIGWDKRAIVSSLVIESYILSLLGGLFGFIISMGMLSGLRMLYYDIAVYLPEKLDMEVFLQSMVICLLIASISIALPAYHAVKITIVRALKNG